MVNSWDGLNECSHGLRYLNMWSPGNGAGWRFRKCGFVGGDVPLEAGRLSEFKDMHCFEFAPSALCLSFKM